MMDDVVINKVQTIERCLKRINDVYNSNPDHLNDFTKQDSIVLNLQRASEASIDLAMYLVAKKKLGVPQTSREAFDILSKQGIIDEQISEKMKAMVGFRNIAVHDYQAINIKIVQQIIEHHLNDFREFTKTILNT